MSIRGRWRVVEIPGYDMAMAGAYILFDRTAGSSPSIASPASFMAPATAMPSSSTGRETTKWSQPTVTAGQNCRMTAHSKVKSAYSTATNPIHRASLKDFFNNLLSPRSAMKSARGKSVSRFCTSEPVR